MRPVCKDHWAGFASRLRILVVCAVGLPAGFLSVDPAGAQPFEQRVGPFPVRDTAGTAYDMPFLGGFDSPRPKLVDIDGDGDLDLFVQEREGRLVFFENTGSSGDGRYEWRTDHFRGLDVGAWARFGDLDDDGDPDLLAEQSTNNVRYFRNDGTEEAPAFAEPVGPLTRADGERLSANQQNVPALVSLECDGPPDLMLGGTDGRLTYQRYVGSRDDGAPIFEKVSTAYQDVCVGPPRVCGFNDEGAGGISSFERRHGANVVAAGDLGGDGDPDLLWGDFFSESLYLLENTGSCDDPQLERVSDVYPTDDPIETAGYNAPALGDVDEDGDLDLVVGVRNSPVENVLFLENTGTDATPSYTLRTRRFLSTIDLGAESVPDVVDLDGDGDRDLVIGNDAEPGGDRARLHVFENVGSSSDPVYEHREEPLLPNAEDGFNFAPAFADVDADGDPDLFLGAFTGPVRFYRNTGTATDPQFERAPSGDVELPQGNAAAPALTDIDADGDPDLFVGSSSDGILAFYRNEGSPQAPDFQLETDRYANIEPEASRTNPAFFDLDEEGTPDLFLGTETGVSLYRNTGTPEEAAFDRPADSLELPMPFLAAPSVADLNGDQIPDLVAGGTGGGLKFFVGMDRTSGPTLEPGAGVDVRPNPFRRRTQLTFSMDESAPVRLSVFDVMGRRVSVLVDRALSAAEHSVSFEAEGRASGVYLYVLRVGDEVRDRGRLVLVR